MAQLPNEVLLIISRHLGKIKGIDHRSVLAAQRVLSPRQYNWINHTREYIFDRGHYRVRKRTGRIYLKGYRWFDDGKVLMVSYYQSGQRKSTMRWEDGRLHGDSEWYFADWPERKRKVSTYCRGTRTSMTLYVHPAWNPGLSEDIVCTGVVFCRNGDATVLY